MNTVGKKGKLGEHVRCVVSVSMLTEGWDANTVTHILGIRAFGSQLLCEQVVGRGLRRRSYAVNDDGRFEPEYAEVYGVPFAFIPSDQPVPEPQAAAAGDRGPRVAGREPTCASRSPSSTATGSSCPTRPLHADFDDDSTLHVDQTTVADCGSRPRASSAQARADRPRRRPQRAPAGRSPSRSPGRSSRATSTSPRTTATERPWLFPQLVDDRQAVARRVRDVDAGRRPWATCSSPQAQRRAAEKRVRRDRPPARTAAPTIAAADPPALRPDGLHRRRALPHPQGRDRPAADEVARQPRRARRRSRATRGRRARRSCSSSTTDVAAYVKNDHLGFAIPYVHEGRTPRLRPRLPRPPRRPSDDDVERTLIVEVSGGQKSPRPDRRRRPTTARDQWCAAVNNHGGFGRWGYVEIAEPGARRPTPRRRHRRPVRRRPDHRRPGLLDLDEETDRCRHAKKPTGPTPVEAITHADKRANLPTADAQDFVAPEVEQPDPGRATRATRRSTRSSCGRARTSSTARTSTPTRRRSTSRRRSTRGCWSRTCAGPPHGREDEPELTLFDTFDGLGELDLVEFYQHEANWSNRMILGDSLQVMASASPSARTLRGKVQMIYIDPPYGIKFGSNWQASARKRDVKDGKLEDAAREVEQIKAFRDTWELGIHSYLTYLRDRLARREGPAHRERVSASSRSATRTSTSCGR